MKLPPPAVAALLALLMWWLASRTPVLELTLELRAVTAVMLLFSGLGVALSGVVFFQRAETTVNPFTPEKTSTLVTSGIYRYSRNPMYLGMLLVLLAWAAWLAAPWTLVGPVVFMAWITRFQVLPEERVLQRHFGQPFEDYCRHVRRWL
jgi:protein-S-isoprenylcysteine O-methyltransferase Ste14